MNLQAIETIVTIGIPIVKRLIPALVETWKFTEKKVPLEEWLSAFGRGRTMEQIYAEARARAAANHTNATVVAVQPNETRGALADEILTAAVTGVIPETWRQADKEATLYLRQHILANG
jgi:hypothetical protein